MAKAGKHNDPLGFAAAFLVIVLAVPVAVFVIPDMAPYVMTAAGRDLGLPPTRAGDLIRAAGLALPALCAVGPPAAVAARKLSPWPILVVGLIVVLSAELAAPYAGSVPIVGVIRVAEGVGAGAILPSTLVLAWEHPERRVLAAVWAGTLTACLVAAMPLLLVRTPVTGGAWWAILRPYPFATGAALIVAEVYGLRRLMRPRRPVITPPRHSERTQLLLPAVPAAGFAFLSVVTIAGWPPGAQLVVAGLGLSGLLGLAVVGSRDATTGSPLGSAVVMVAAGVVAMPVAVPWAGLLGARDGPGSIPLLPFAGAAGCAFVSALVAAGVGRRAGRGVILAGFGLELVAVVMFLLVAGEDGTAARWASFGPPCALAAGVGLGLGTALRHAEIGAALFGLSLCFPAVLAGHLVIGALQVAELDATVTPAAGQAALTSAFRIWMVIAGIAMAVLAAITFRLGRDRGTAPPSRAGRLLGGPAPTAVEPIIRSTADV